MIFIKLSVIFSELWVLWGNRWNICFFIKKKKMVFKMCIMNFKWIKYFFGLCIFFIVIFKYEFKGVKVWKKVNWSY